MSLWMPQYSLSTFQYAPGYPDAALSVQMSPQDTQVSLKMPRCCPMLLQSAPLSALDAQVSHPGAGSTCSHWEKSPSPPVL